MNKSHVPSKVLILMLAACLVWIGLISLAYVILSGSGISTTWIVGGALVFAVIAWVLVMIREIRDSILLPEGRDQNGEVARDFEELKKPPVAAGTARA